MFCLSNLLRGFASLHPCPRAIFFLVALVVSWFSCDNGLGLAVCALGLACAASKYSALFAPLLKELIELNSIGSVGLVG